MFLFRLSRLLRVLPLAFLAFTGCSSLGTLDAVLPKDSGSSLVAGDLAYGEDPRQRLDIYAPDNAGGTRGHPVVVFVHGGSWASGEREDYSFAGRALASQGFVTVLFNYRLVPRHPYPDFVDDTASVVAWANRNAARYGGDPSRIFLVGHSAGAYNAVMVALAPEFLRGVGVSQDVLAGVVGISGPYDFLPLDPGAAQNAFGHLQAEALRDSQPVNRVTASRPVPPMLLLTGDKDKTVRPRNTQSLAQALEKAGHRVRSEIYPGIGHAGTVLALSRPFRGRAPVLEDVATFIRGQ